MRTVAVLALVVAISGCAVSTQQEVEMGASYAAEINRQLPLVQDAELNRYINVLGDSIARIADTRNLDWQFHIVNSPDVNAFAVPGGFIYINRGLIDRAKTLSQVAGVIGLLGVCIFTNMCASETGQALMQIGTGAAMASFSRADEDDADLVAVDYMVRARIDPTGIPEMFQILLDERKVKPEGLETWFTSHPLEESRIAASRARIAALPAGTTAGLTKDSQAFQAFKRRLATIPAAPAGSATSPR